MEKRAIDLLLWDESRYWLTEPATVERDGSVPLMGANRPAKRDAFNLAATDAGSHRLANMYGRIGVEYGASRLRPRVAMGQSIHLR